MSTNPLRVAVIGLGTHGRRFVRLAAGGGAVVVGAADPAQSGRLLAEVAEAPGVGEVVVAPDFAGLRLSKGDVDVVVLAHHDNLEALADHAVLAAEIGANVVSYLVSGFDIEEYSDELRERIDDAARAHGVTVVSSGSQDVSWGGLLVHASSQVRDLREARVELTLGLDGYPIDFVSGIGAAMDEEQYARDVAAHAESWPSVVIPTLKVTARTLGLTVTAVERTIERVVRDEPVSSVTFGRDLLPGETIGSRDVAVLRTEEGIDLVAVFTTLAVLPGVEDRWVFHIKGDPDIELEQRITVPPDTVDAIIVNRLPDVVAAKPGLLSASELPQPQYRVHLTRD